MKKTKFAVVLTLMCILLGFGGIPGNAKVQAALSNVMKAPNAKAGTWIMKSKGYQYRYKATGKFAKNVWCKIDGNIYYFKSNGYLQTGWKVYNKNRYYFNNQGVLQTGWKTLNGKKYYLKKTTGAAAIGKVKIGSRYYYFSSTGARQTGWRKVEGYYYYFYPDNGSMAVNTKIGKYYVDKNGRRTSANTSTVNTGESALKKTGKVDYFVGDSRTVGMGAANGKSSQCIAKVGEGYNWYCSTALPKLKARLKKKPAATVVLNFGVNDIDNYSKYIAAYKKLIKAYPKAKIYIMSVNPIGKKYTWGYYSCSTMRAKVKTFNNKMKAAFPNRYIDCYTYLNKNGFSTVDGIHYTTATYKAIYKYILTKV
ncbi:MAG: GDSL-type esterase/lipase family protein [Eubacteriales bacterium]|nr:GDSL-type esterase/lipase family protein [Eubacteriales bacterium]